MAKTEGNGFGKGAAEHLKTNHMASGIKKVDLGMGGVRSSGGGNAFAGRGEKELAKSKGCDKFMVQK